MNNTTGSEIGQERPRRIDRPHRNWVIRGLNQMATLNDAQKRLWLEMMHLDQLKPDGSEPGCYAGAEILAQRTGWSVQKLERVRRELKAMGLVVNRDRPGYRNDTWYPTIPVPLPFVPIRHPTPEQGIDLARQLDEAVSATKNDTSLGNLPITADTTHLSKLIPPL